MNINNKFKKYRYLGMVYPETEESWKPIVLNMLKEIDKYIRPWYIPKFALNIVLDSNKRNIIWYWNQILSLFIPGIYISQIKSKFATLRVYGVFDNHILEIIKKAEEQCSDTCEICGNSGCSHVMIKGWVTNLCETCKENLKK